MFGFFKIFQGMKFQKSARPICKERQALELREHIAWKRALTFNSNSGCLIIFLPFWNWFCLFTTKCIWLALMCSLFIVPNKNNKKILKTIENNCYMPHHMLCCSELRELVGFGMLVLVVACKTTSYCALVFFWLLFVNFFLWVCWVSTLVDLNF